MQEPLPPRLAALCAEVSLPRVISLELATTPDETWIVRAYMDADDPETEADLRRRFGDFADRVRVVHEAPRTQVARPAWPGRGE